MPEYFDTYDKDWRPLGGLHLRGEPLPNGVYHLVVAVFTVNSAGQILLTKRHPRKSSGNCWECTGGCTQAGDTGLSAARRELWEEIGLKAEKLILLGKDRIDAPGDPQLCHAYLYFRDVPISALHLQETEVVEAVWASPEQVDYW